MNLKSFFIILLLSVLNKSFGQAPYYVWAKESGGVHEDRGKCIATDYSGNVYVAGDFSSSSITFGTTTLLNPDSTLTRKFFVVKYDAIGNVIWAKGATNSNRCEPSSVAADATGNVYVTGFFTGDTLDLGTIILLNSGGSYSMFLIKYDSNGNLLWAKNAVGQHSQGNSVAVAQGGFVCVTGFYAGTSIAFGNIVLPSAQYEDIFVVKYDSNGNPQWARKQGGSNGDKGIGVDCDSNGNIFITGYFSSTSITFGNTTLTNSSTFGESEVFVFKYDSSGNPLWAKNAIGIASEEGNSITIDSNGDAILTGYFYSPTLSFGSINISTIGISEDIFIAKYDSSGNIIWAKGFGGISQDRGQSISTDVSNNIYLTGYFSSPHIIFGSTALTNNDTATMQNGDLFIAKFSPIGNVQWALTCINYSNDAGMGIATDNTGNIYVAGLNTSSANSISFGTITLSGPGGVFVTKIGNITSIQNENELENSILFYPNPTSNIITLNQKGNVRIYNSLGECILNKEYITDYAQIDLSDQPSGIYFVSLVNSNFNFTKTLILK